MDGTRAFITGRHEWGSLIALEQDGVPVLGILDQPVLGERFIGVNGRPSDQDGVRTPLKVRDCAEPERRHPLRHRSVGLHDAAAAGGVRAGEGEGAS